MFQIIWIKPKVDDLDVVKLKIVLIDLKRLNDVVDKKVVKKQCTTN